MVCTAVCSYVGCTDDMACSRLKRCLQSKVGHGKCVWIHPVIPDHLTPSLRQSYAWRLSQQCKAVFTVLAVPVHPCRRRRLKACKALCCRSASATRLTCYFVTRPLRQPCRSGTCTSCETAKVTEIGRIGTSTAPQQRVNTEMYVLHLRRRGDRRRGSRRSIAACPPGRRRSTSLHACRARGFPHPYFPPRAPHRLRPHCPSRSHLPSSQASDFIWHCLAQEGPAYAARIMLLPA